ncbi:hypothetical protein NMP99_09925 [Glutamicibacter mishrai]|uniref:Uncharacterized protein n=1 Tax=Glutamicibacter mishrai TaxID=1775880 RepID=A0A6H0SFA3_9MICC|nr:hypothetical protein [Glutamicibacter mishrai]KUM31669.1 hypothetical protein AQ436_00650 [Arthrobacter sp. EpRS66]QIV85830.1 hypothetical protein D3791_01040 [Glutamicibacter mishrai]UTT38378.1 hypothetical protein NMP99_09925 [Glutamicibacter mishrai]
MYKVCKWTTLAAFAVALVLWLGFGGRAEFVSQEQGPYSPVVYISGWLALLGIITATIMTVGFFGNSIQRTVKRNAIRYGMRK